MPSHALAPLAVVLNDTAGATFVNLVIPWTLALAHGGAPPPSTQDVQNNSPLGVVTTATVLLPDAAMAGSPFVTGDVLGRNTAAIVDKELLAVRTPAPASAVPPMAAILKPVTMAVRRDIDFDKGEAEMFSFDVFIHFPLKYTFDLPGLPDVLTRPCVYRIRHLAYLENSI